MKPKPLSKDAALRARYIEEGVCGRCKVRDIDYDRSISKCARCLDRAKAESVARTAGVKPVYPDDSAYPPPNEAKAGRPPKGKPKGKPKGGKKRAARAKQV